MDADYGSYTSNALNVWWDSMSILSPDLWLADVFQFLQKVFSSALRTAQGLFSQRGSSEYLIDSMTRHLMRI